MEVCGFGVHLILFGILLNLIKFNHSLIVTTALSEVATKGDTAILRCVYANENSRDTIFVVLWQKLDAATAVTSTIYNSQTDGRQANNATRFKLSGLASLQINPVLLSDEGRYRCQVTPLPSFEQDDAFTNLEVTYPPEFDIPVNSTLFVNDGDQVILPCHARGNPNLITYTWFYKPVNGVERLLHVRSDRQLHYEQGKRLRIHFLEEHEGTFRCEAKSSVGSSSLSIQLVLNRAARFTHTPGSPVTAIEGEDVVIEVEGTGTPNNLTYKWFYRGIPIDLFGWSSVFGFNTDNVMPYLRITRNVTRSRLEIKEVQREVAGVYSCSVFNLIGTPASVNISLNVQYPVSLNKAPLKTYSVVEGQDFSLFCSGIGNPIYSIEWKTPDWKILPTKSCADRYSVLSNGTLNIKPAHRNDTGNYTCTLFNSVGKPAKATSLITVNYAPQFVQPLKSAYSVMLGSNLSLPCLTSGVPQPTITWFKNSIELQQDSERPSIKFVDIQPYNLGKYRCQAENHLGMAFMETQVYVLYKPTIQRIPPVLYIDFGEDVEILCVASGYPLPLVEWERLSNEPSLSNMAINNITKEKARVYETIHNLTINSTLSIKQVNMQDFGTYSCGAYNDVGTDKSAITLAVKAKDVPPTPRNVTVTGVAEFELSIVWKYDKPVGNGAQYFCEVWTTSPECLHKVVSCQIGSCALTSLRPSTTYWITLFGNNSAGESERSSRMLITTEASTATSPVPIVTNFIETSLATFLQRNVTLAISSRPSLNLLSTRPPIDAVNDNIIHNVTYDVSDGCVRWQVLSDLEKVVTRWNFTAVPNCVKIEAKQINSTLWHVLTWCVAALAKVCSANILRTDGWMVRVSLCWALNKGCGQPVLAEKFVKTLITSGELPSENEIGGFWNWLPAFGASVIAISFILVLYACTYVYMRHRRRTLAFQPFGRGHSRRQGAPLSSDVSRDSRRRRHPLSRINHRRFLARGRSTSLPGYYTRSRI